MIDVFGSNEAKTLDQPACMGFILMSSVVASQGILLLLAHEQLKFACLASPSPHAQTVLRMYLDQISKHIIHLHIVNKIF